MGNRCLNNERSAKAHALTHYDIKPEDLISSKNESVKNEYSLKRLLDQNPRCKVFMGIHKVTQAQSVVKQYSKKGLSVQEIDSLKREFTVLKSLDHPNIIRVLHLYQEDKAVYIVTEYLQGGELLSRLADRSRYREEEASYYIHDLLNAASYCHQRGLVHKNIRPQNILFTSQHANSLKLADFKLFSFIDENSKIEGSPTYMAPQLIKGTVSSKCDVWSIGVILYLLLTGQLPFVAKNSKQMVKKIEQGYFEKDLLRQYKISPAAQDLVFKMLAVDPKQRPEAAALLKHQWISNPLSMNPSSSEISQTLKNLGNFYKQSMLSKAIQFYIYNEYSNRQQVANLTEIFNQMDTNKDGCLSKEQIQQTVKNYHCSEEYSDMLKQIIEDSEREIKYSEFIVAAMSKKKYLSEQRVDDVFRQIDKDRSGFIQVSEIRNVLLGIQDTKVDYLIKEIDRNGDGKISIDEWRNMLRA